jgi:hypothetical protein
MHKAFRQLRYPTSPTDAILTQPGTLGERRPEQRHAGTCRDLTVLLCAQLPQGRRPRRAGFAGYFTGGFFDDHWVVEVWHDDRS